MMYRTIIFWVVPLLLMGFSRDSRYPKDNNATFVDSLNVSVDIGYGVHLIDVTSLEINRAIDYRILEATIGASYSIGNGNIGFNTKALIQEQKSNLSLVNTSRLLNDQANIEREEFSLYGNYFLDTLGRSMLNVVYRYYYLKANHRYINFNVYDTHFGYTTQGFALSYLYKQPISYEGSQIVWGAGLLYSHAKVEIFETINGALDDAYIDDSQNALGIKASLGFVYRVDNMKFKIIAN